MWADAIGKLEDMESSNRERLWPQLVKGFKDLSERLKVFDMTTFLIKTHVKTFILLAISVSLMCT